MTKTDFYKMGTREQAATLTDESNFNAAELHYELCSNAEYRVKFADQVYKHCLKPGGAMTAPVAEARFRSRMAELDDAVVCEAARWRRAAPVVSPSSPAVRPISSRATATPAGIPPSTRPRRSTPQVAS